MKIDEQLDTIEQQAKSEIAQEFLALGELEKHINGLATFTFQEKRVVASAFHYYRNHLKELLDVPT